MDDITNIKKNQNKRYGTIRVHDGNNRIIEDSSSSKVKKTDFYEIMSNHWKKLHILREQANSAKSIENDQKASKAKLDEDKEHKKKANIPVQIEAKAECSYQTDEVKVNTILLIKAGEIISIDDVVIDGDYEVDEKTLTGGHSLETLAKIKVIAFDKIVTIGKDESAVKKISISFG
jgi:cation transport ATPase